MNKYEALQKHNEAREKQRQADEVYLAMLNMLPEDLDFKGFGNIGYKAAWSMSFEVEGLKDITPIMDKLKPIHLVKHRDGCMSFMPLEAMTDKEREHGETQDVAPFVYYFDTYSKEVHWYTHIEGVRVSVHVKITGNDGSRLEECHRRDDRTKQIIDYKWRLRSPLAEIGTAGVWASGDRKTPGKCYVQFDMGFTSWSEILERLEAYGL